jgi:PTS system galactitol-specific IIA component
VEESFEYFTIINLDANTQEEVLDDISGHLLEKGFVHNSFREAVKERERIYPTGIKTMRYGVAIPHVEPEHVIKNAICVVTLKRPVLFGEMGGEENDQVDVECLFICLLNARDHNMKIMAHTLDILQNVKDLDVVRDSVSDDEIRELLVKYAKA